MKYMMNKQRWFIAIGLIVLASCVAVVMSGQKTGAPSGDELTDSKAVDLPVNNAIALAGRYTDYSEDKVDDYAATILFFHASWCVECRGFEMAINSKGVPDDVQILKIDYDSSQDLRQRYGVTIQSTFVRVDKNGDKQKSWTGYGKEKTVDAILENTQ